jgi:hypothetical protein
MTIRNLLLAALAAAAAVAFLVSSFVPAFAANYYADQTNFEETSVPVARYHWSEDIIDSCIYKDENVPNKYYAWAKLAAQQWRQALREYTDNQQAWELTTRYVSSQSELRSCDVRVFIFDSYMDFPDYPSQTGAYTSVKFDEGSEGEIDANVYLSPFILHGDGETEIDLPSYVFRNSAVHELGHVLGLGHMQSARGYLMSPQFDFWEEDDQLSITTLELEALVSVYGNDGFD